MQSHCHTVDFQMTECSPESLQLSLDVDRLIICPTVDFSYHMTERSPESLQLGLDVESLMILVTQESGIPVSIKVLSSSS